MLADWLSGHSVLREIENEFEAEGFQYRSGGAEVGGGQRRSMVQGYYGGIDFTEPGQVNSFLRIVSLFMREMERRGATEPSFLEDFARFNEQLQRDGYEYRDAGISGLSAAGIFAKTMGIADLFSATHIMDQIRRIEASVETDPALAIGTAKELVESCFKTILVDRGIEFNKNDDLPQLGRRVFKALHLLPEDVPESAKGAEVIRRLLSNLATVTQGLAEVRGLYGTGHGRDGRARGVAPRHARLCVTAAGAIVTFVFETHIESIPGRASVA